MLSILRRATDDGHFARFDAHLFFGVRAERDAFYLEELTAIRARHPGRITVTVALSDEEAPRSLVTAHPALDFVPGPRPRGRGQIGCGAASRTSGPMSPGRDRWWTRAFVCCSRWAACPLRRSVATDSTRAANSTTWKENEKPMSLNERRLMCAGNCQDPRPTGSSGAPARRRNGGASAPPGRSPPGNEGVRRGRPERARRRHWATSWWPFSRSVRTRRFLSSSVSSRAEH